MTPEEIAAAEAADKAGKKADLTQEKVEELINSAFASGARKVETEKLQPIEAKLAEATTKLTEMTAKLTELEGKSKVHTPTDDVTKDAEARLAAIQAKLDEAMGNFKVVQSERDTLKTEKAKAEEEAHRSTFERTFDETADEFKFFRNKTVRLELQDQLKYENGKIVVLNPRTGQERLNTEMQPFTLKDLLAEYSKKFPEMVKTEAAGGSGSQETREVINNHGGLTKSIADLTPAEFQALTDRVAAGERIPLA